MASDVQVGDGIVRGILNNGTPITMTGIASFHLQSVKLTHDFEEDELKGADGFTATVTAVDANVKLDIQWTPSGATRAAAHDTLILVPPLSKITLANFKGAGSPFNGDYQNRSGGAIDLEHKDGKMSLKLKRWTDDDQNTLLTTTVNG